MNSRKVLLLGPPLSGKSCIHHLIFGQLNPHEYRGVRRTIELDPTTTRFLDTEVTFMECGGQKLYVGTYSTEHLHDVFCDTCIMVFVIDVCAMSDTPMASTSDSRPTYAREQVLAFLSTCVGHLRQLSPNARTVCLLNKTDLLAQEWKDVVLKARREEVWEALGEFRDGVTLFETNKWDDSLFVAWRYILMMLMPQFSSLEGNMLRLRTVLEASEIALLERRTMICCFHCTEKGVTDTTKLGSSVTLPKLSQTMKRHLRTQTHHSTFQRLQVKSGSLHMIIDSFTEDTLIVVLLKSETARIDFVARNVAAARRGFNSQKRDVDDKPSIGA